MGEVGLAEVRLGSCSGWFEQPDEYRLTFSCRCLKLRMSPEVPRRQAAAKLCPWDLGQGKTAPLPLAAPREEKLGTFFSSL